tara:strand:- start:1791 stop:2810 length:1020 start_codon:yes stop_codon:yes gene_type:complete
MSIIITGAAGFIGFHLCNRLLDEGYKVIGIDNFNSYYDVKLKKSRIEYLKKKNNEETFKIFKGELEDNQFLDKIFKEYNPKIVINLAAQAGVRYSIENPSAYIQSNLVGFANILEFCRNSNINHLIYASSSSVYGGNTKFPFSENDSVDHPVSLYAATKRSNELMAHTYSHLYNLPTTGLRFFTVYGPWGRPDMALFLFTKSIIEGKPINIFNHGKMIRDFTFIDDVIESLYRLIMKSANVNKKPKNSKLRPSESWAPFKIFNVGNSNPVSLIDYIEEIEKCLDKKAIKNYTDMQPGDVSKTYSDTKLLENFVNYKPTTKIEEGVKKFVDWYINYYQKN